MSLPESTSCPVCKIIQGELNAVRIKQVDRPCSGHEMHLKAHDKNIADLEEDNRDQWTAINQLRKHVWGWAGIASFLGSGLGAAIVSYLLKK